MQHLALRFPLMGRSIRQKVMLGVAFCLLGLGALGGVACYYLTQMTFTLQISSDMDDLSADVAEARRAERQYYRHGQLEDRAEVVLHVDKALQRLNTILRRVEANRHMEMARKDKILLPRLQSDLNTYKIFWNGVPAPHLGQSELATQAGRQVAQATRLLVLQLRDDINNMVESLQEQLCWAILTLLGLTLAGGWLMVRRILRALDLIESATRRIAQGNFTPLAVASTEEETGQVISAINQMVGELEKKQHKLEQERKLASLGVLTAGIAHQLNNPLNNIYSTCQLLQESVQEGEEGLRPVPSMSHVEQKLEIVMQEVRRSRRIIRGLLDFSHESPLTTTPCCLATVVQHALKLSAPYFPVGTQVHCHVPQDMVLPLDARRFQEACINLLINAGEALGNKAGEIHIRAHESGGRAVLEIEDTGEGIAPEHQQKIFDPFFTSKSMGTGLGLSITFGIIRKHGGSISVKSAPDAGSTFTISLPLPQGNTPENSA